ncbi:MAG TPA: hypothetical protein VE988_18890 [Gemmataceae bacterium]|nr:hypothetical protein [Gemmataceae bacterium]
MRKLGLPGRSHRDHRSPASSQKKQAPTPEKLLEVAVVVATFDVLNGDVEAARKGLESLELPRDDRLIKLSLLLTK